MADHGVEFWAAVASPSAEPFDSVERPLRLALVLGDEDRGVEPDWLSRCTRQVTIPMRGRAGSLNVSVAAGILLYQLSKPSIRRSNHSPSEAAGGPERPGSGGAFGLPGGSIAPNSLASFFLTI